MVKRRQAWWAAIVVTLITAAVVAIDSWDTSARRYWSRHSFTTNVSASVLVLALTVLIIDRVTRMRQLRSEKRVVAVQAAILLTQARRAADAIARVQGSGEAHAAAPHELLTYTQMLFTSAPVLIGTEARRQFLETAQRAAAHLGRALRDAGDERDTKTHLGEAIELLRAAAAPLLADLHPELGAMVGSGEIDLRER